MLQANKNSHYGTPDDLIPFLNYLDSWQQDEGRSSISFIHIKNIFDLIQHFVQPDEFTLCSKNLILVGGLYSQQS